MSTRTLALTSPLMTGDDVELCQKDINHRLKVWKVPLVIDVDRAYGPQTRDAAASVLYGLGVEPGASDGVGPTDRLKIRHGYERLTAAEKKRHKAREDWRKRLADRYGGGAVEQALDFARSKIGVKEQPANSNRGPQIDDWERACDVLAAPWCGCFVNAVLVHAGMKSQIWLRYCPSIEAMARAGSAYGWKWTHDPRPGDLVLYGSSIAQHVGIVETVGGGEDTATIEGNTSNGPGGSQSNGGAVARRRRHTDGSLSGFPIRGYARPPWE